MSTKAKPADRWSHDDEDESVRWVATRRDAKATRPKVDDPTHLENGNVHPRYVEWMLRPRIETAPWREFVFGRLDDLPVTSDDRFDREAVIARLGKRGPEMLLMGNPLPTKPKMPIVAELLGLTSQQVIELVLAERKARSEHEAMLASCRWHPARLISWRSMNEGKPCPGCGRSWVGELDDEDAFRAEHTMCGTSMQRFADGPEHCSRCCGMPPASPRVLKEVRGMLRRFAQQHDERATVDARVQRTQKSAATRRARREQRIATLEAELARLRSEQQTEQ